MACHQGRLYKRGLLSERARIVLQSSDFSTVLICHLLKTLPLPWRKLTTVVPTHPSFRATQAQFQELKATGFCRREPSRCLSLPDAVLLPMFTLVNRLSCGGYSGANRRNCRHRNDKRSYCPSPFVSSATFRRSRAQSPY